MVLIMITIRTQTGFPIAPNYQRNQTVSYLRISQTTLCQTSIVMRSKAELYDATPRNRQFLRINSNMLTDKYTVLIKNIKYVNSSVQIGKIF